MRLGIRGKLFLWTLLLVAAVDLAVGLYLSAELRRGERQRIESRLRHHARVCREALDVAEPALSVEAIDPLTDRLGAAIDARVTVIAPDGTVLGDSELTAVEVAAVERHDRRPEVLAARQSGVGVAQRHSDTLREDMLYLAVPWQRNGAAGVVRVAASMEQVDAALARLRTILLLAGLIAVALSAILVAGATALVSRTLQSVVARARNIAHGEVTPGPALPDGDELDGLVGSMNKLARDLQDTVSDLAKERDRLTAVLHGMHESLIAVDEQLRISLVNRGAVELLELPEDVGGRPLLDVIRIPALTDLVEAAAGGESVSSEFELPGATPRRVLAHATLHQGQGTVVVLHDVSEIRRLERVRQDFVANVSHELRTPVSIIRANAETLLSGGLEHPEQARRFLNALLRSSDRLGRLISDLLDISRIEAGQYRVERTLVPLAPLVARVVESVESQAAAKNTTIEVDIPARLAARGDMKALEQVVANLVDNAIKYTPRDGSVWIAARAEEGTVRLEVADDGPGIEPAHRARVFERFFRVDPGRSRDMGGTGLGLSIVKHLTDAMGGTVGVDARVPRGSTFWLRLPAG